ncbi:MAG: hypothetical protein R2828_02095 [Saprospiraceae bacterium]
MVNPDGIWGTGTGDFNGNDNIKFNGNDNGGCVAGVCPKPPAKPPLPPPLQ